MGVPPMIDRTRGRDGRTTPIDRQCDRGRSRSHGVGLPGSRGLQSFARRNFL